MTKNLTKYDNITPDQVDLIKSQIAVGATDNELKLFLHVADKSGLDPLSRQIYFIKRSGKMTIQTAIDGFRAIADRTGQYIGSNDPIFEGSEKVPLKATVTVCKVVQGVVGQFTATARWDEYYPGKSQGFMWDKMPHTMLGKCAEALALRKAFPAQLSGLYTGDEMAQAGDVGIPKEINPTKGSDQLKVALTEEVQGFATDEEAGFKEVITPPPSVEDSKKLLDQAQTKLDEAFAFCETEQIHTNIINNLNDIKYVYSAENKEILTNFAKTYPANQQLFQNVAKKYKEEWMEAMFHEDWQKLITYMAELNDFFPVVEEEIA